MLDELISNLIAASGRILWKFSEYEEDWSEWGRLRDTLEAVAPFLSPEDRTRVLDIVADFDCRLSVNMIGRP
jgi:hypothetical protein